MGNVQKTDKAMRGIAIFGGIVALIEAVAIIMGLGLMGYGWGTVGGVIALILAIIAIFLGIKPLRYTAIILVAIGVLLIVFAALIGGIFVIFAAFMGLIS